MSQLNLSVDTRICSVCHETKPSNEFTGSRGRKTSCCKDCNNARHKRWRDANKERLTKNRKEYADKNRSVIRAQKRKSARKQSARDKHRENQLRARYGLTVEQWEAMFDKQGHRCAVCKTAKAHTWCTDHDHATDVIRGILCSPCNRSIGQLGDDAAGVQRALAYLDRGANTVEEHW